MIIYIALLNAAGKRHFTLEHGKISWHVKSALNQNIINGKNALVCYRGNFF